ncbi:MAG: BBP7 family outer membrane beta-barrel protein [Planctomycetaceae bacterium]
MTGRLFSLFLLIVACSPARPAFAQAMPWNQGYGNNGYGIPASVAGHPGDPLGGTTYPQWGDPPFSGGALYSNDTVDGNYHAAGSPGHLGYPDAYGQPLGSGPYYPPGAAAGIGYKPPFSPQYATDLPYQGQGPKPENIYEMLPADRGLLYDEDIAFLKTRRDAMIGAYARLEYVAWRMQNPGHTLLGAPIAGLDNPRDPFVVQLFDATGNLNAVGTARVADLGPVNLENMNGTRFAWGVPTEFGEIEGNVWGLANKSRFGAAELLEPPNTSALPTNPNARLIATSLLDNGDPSSLLILYDRDFRVTYDVETFGTEFNIARNMRTSQDGFVLQSLFGFRYMGHTEAMTQQGSFDNRSSLDNPNPLPPIIPVNQLTTPVDNGIFSEARNRVFSLQFGLKSEYRNRWFAVGIAPKVAFGANHYKAAVMTSNLRDSPAIIDPANTGPISTLPGVQDDGTVLTSLTRNEFTPTFDLGLYARVNPTEWLSLHVGYNLLWMDNIARADEIVYYNDVGLDRPPAVVAKPHTADMWMQGISIGGQITLPRR